MEGIEILMINKSKNFFKKHKYFILTMLIFTLCFSSIVSQVVLYADDFELAQKASTHSLKVIFDEFKNIYLKWGGGPTPGLAIIVLNFGLVFWKILNILMVSASVYMATDIIIPNNKKSDKNQAIVSGIIWCLFLLMNISVAKETLYWFDGSMAYILTTFLTFSYFYFCYKIIFNQKKFLKKDVILLSILGFFAGWNGPQTGALSCGLVLGLLLWQYFYKKEKLNKAVLISLIFSIIGFLILYFAPGNSSRMATFEEYNSLTLFGKVIYRIPNIISLIFDQIYYSKFFIPTYLILSSMLLLFLTYVNLNKIKRKKIVYFTSLFVVIYILFYIIFIHSINNANFYKPLELIYNFSVTQQTGKFLSFMVIFKYCLAVCYLLAFIYISFENSLVMKKPLVFLTAMGAIGSQLIMVMAPYSPMRTTYIGIFFFIILISNLIYSLKDFKNYISVAIIITLLFFDFQLGILVAILYFILYILKIQKNEGKILLGFVIILTLTTTFYNFYQYRINKIIDKENIRLIEEYKENGQQGDLVIYKFQNENYAFTPLYSEIDWIRKGVIKYYDLKPDVKIIATDFNL